jgi:hypothetical protein
LTSYGIQTEAQEGRGYVSSKLNDGLTALKFRYARDGDDLLNELINLAGDVDRYLQRIERGDQEGIRLERENMRCRRDHFKELLQKEKL